MGDSGTMEMAKMVLDLQKTESSRVGEIMSKLDNNYLNEQKDKLIVTREGKNVIYHDDEKFMNILENSGLYQREVAEFIGEMNDYAKESILNKVWTELKNKVGYTPVHTFDPLEYIQLRWENTLREKAMEEMSNNGGEENKYKQLKSEQVESIKRMQELMERIKS